MVGGSAASPELTLRGLARTRCTLAAILRSRLLPRTLRGVGERRVDVAVWASARSFAEAGVLPDADVELRSSPLAVGGRGGDMTRLRLRAELVRA